MYEVVTRGLKNPRERWCLAACVALCALWVLTFAILALSSTRIDDVFFARRDALLVNRLRQFRLPLGSPVTVSQDGAVTPSVLLHGWSVPEARGVWTDGPRADITVALPVSRPSNSALELWAAVMLPPVGGQAIRLHAGGQMLGEWRFSSPQAVICIPLPAGAETQAGLLRVDVDVASPQSPPGGLDPRRLGLGLERLELLPNPSQCERQAQRPSS